MARSGKTQKKGRRVIKGGMFGIKKSLKKAYYAAPDITGRMQKAYESAPDVTGRLNSAYQAAPDITGRMKSAYYSAPNITGLFKKDEWVDTRDSIIPYADEINEVNCKKWNLEKSSEYASKRSEQDYRECAKFASGPAKYKESNPDFPLSKQDRLRNELKRDNSDVIKRMECENMKRNGDDIPDECFALAARTDLGRGGSLKKKMQKKIMKKKMQSKKRK